MKSASKVTHFLSRVEGGTNEDTERKPAKEGHLLPVENREGQVRTPKEAY
jgi:hypothetical protein